MSLHYNVRNSYLFLNGTEIIKFTAKDSEVVTPPLCLWTKKTDLNGYVYDLSVCYDTIAVDDILNTHKYSMEMNNII